MLVYQGTKAVWIPAFAGMTMVGSKRLRNLFLDFANLLILQKSKEGFQYSLMDKHPLERCLYLSIHQDKEWL